MKMNTAQKLDAVRMQFGSNKNPNPPMRIDWMFSVAWSLLKENKNADSVCLVYLHVENGIGIARYGYKGYTPTPCRIRPGVDGQAAVDWFNENILGLSAKESSKIVLNTMRK